MKAPGTIYTSTMQGAPVWLVQLGDAPGFGDEIWRTEADAVKASENFLRRQAERRASSERQAAEEARESEAKAAREDLNGFDSGMTPMQRGRVLKVLAMERVWRGGVHSRRDIVRALVAEGRKVALVDGKRVLMAEDGAFCNLTGYGADYAEFLIGKLEPPSGAPCAAVPR